MLCNECQSIFKAPLTSNDGPQTAGGRKEASHKRMTELVDIKIRSTNCFICHTCIRTCVDDDLVFDEEQNCVVVYSLSIPNNASIPPQLHVNCYTHPDESFSYVWFELSRITSEAHISQEISGIETSVNAVSEFSRAMLAECQNQHNACEVQDSNNFYPTRLIEVTKQSAVAVAARLVNTTELPPDSPYCTLSHCWGGIDIERLLSSNLVRMTNNIDVSVLPKTFQDALVVTSALGLKYIWIDSLCIIQDSAQDWKHEAARMRSIYRSARVNIAATKARDGRDGLFTKKIDGQHLSAVVILNHGPQQGQFEIIEKNYWERMVNTAPLNQRAWVVQERLLSPRTLHFTIEQVIWDCACTTRPQISVNKVDVWNRPGAQVSGNGPKQAFRLLQDTKSTHEANDHWLTVVQAYSQSHLTYHKDKLIALSGLVEHFQHITKDRYHAGLWHENIALQLAWHRRRDNDSIPPSSARTNRAPSWSWLSYNEPVTFLSRAELRGYNVQDLIRDVNSHLKHADSDDGDILKGYLRLTAVLTPLSETEEKGLQLAKPLLPPFVPEYGLFHCNFDCRPADEVDDIEYFFLPLFSVLFQMTAEDTFDNTGIIQGVIVRLVPEYGAYVRCGQAVLSVRVTEPFKGIESYMRGTKTEQQVVKMY